MPSFRHIGASYSSPLAAHLSRLARDVVQSDLYKKLFPHIEIRVDQNTKIHWANTLGGSRYAVGANGAVTGMHGHVITIDDPLNPNEAASETELNQTNTWVQKTLLSRKVDLTVSQVQLVMQRLHENDPTALFLAKGKLVRHLCFPAELNAGYEVKPRHCKRYYVDGLFDAKRFPKPVLEEKEQEMGSVAYAGQYGQNPVPPGGAMFDVEQISIHPIGEPLPKFTKVVRFWDKAGTTAKEDARAARTAGVKQALTEEGITYILDVKRGRWNTGVREKIIRNTARRDGHVVAVGLEQEPGSGGKESAQKTKKMLRGHRVYVLRPTGDKEKRAVPFSVEVNMGRVVVVPGPWVKEYLKELMYFPYGRFKDQVDASSGGQSVFETGMRVAGGVSFRNRVEEEVSEGINYRTFKSRRKVSKSPKEVVEKYLKVRSKDVLDVVDAKKNRLNKLPHTKRAEHVGKA
jgi:predicted phage terminase large subunit-like protein